ncbi:hypothetical protein SOCE26_025630 [Sorangium cellulosum]|uniref:Secreted protein n=1 Tax=Sorangium cellulosum TaxID=56 RepID=A0A2L0EPD6_SORCE|nr:hypothetical protein [Sorangium cellulosum]AUX41156.1 hypothetical protein SOCE26_025630 [Sorangium cellulosum]
MTMQKKRKVLRAPFIVTVAAAASLAGAVALPGCDPTVQGGSCPAELPERGSSCDADDLACDYIDSCDNPIDYRCVDGAWQVEAEMSCNPPPPPECPEQLPEAGSGCWQLGASCAYSDPPDCPEPTIVTCGDDGAWSVTVAVACNPPPPGCPGVMPESGDPCDAELGTCGYMMMTGCGPMPIDAVCVLEDDTWRWQVHEIACNPPPPDLCLTAATAEACTSLGPTCQWLVPGCADDTGAPALSAAGCFPSLPCETDDVCPAGTLCEEVVVNPCVASSPDGVTCAACGLYTNVCVPPSAATTTSG